MKEKSRRPKTKKLLEKKELRLNLYLDEDMNDWVEANRGRLSRAVFVKELIDSKMEKAK